jgi:hypothetical protein
MPRGGAETSDVNVISEKSRRIRVLLVDENGRLE